MHPYLPKHIQALAINSHFQVVEIQGDITRFIDTSLLETLSNEIKGITSQTSKLISALIGLEIGDLFPELFGVEDLLAEVATGVQQEFSIKSIGRLYESEPPLYFDIYAIAHPTPSDENYLVLLLEDVTDRMSLEQVLVQATNEKNLLIQDLESTKSQLHSIIASMTEILILVSESGYIQLVNSATVTLLGYSEQELIGCPLSILTNITQQNLNQSEVNGQLFDRSLLLSLDEGEVICYKKNREPVVIAFSKSIISKTISGKSARKDTIRDFLYVGRDITRDKQQQRYQKIQHIATRMMSESTLATQTIFAIISSVCQEFNWQIGSFWVIDRTESGSKNLESQHLIARCMDCWVAPDLALFEWKHEFQSGIPILSRNLIGRIYHSRNCQWSSPVSPSDLPTYSNRTQLLNFQTGLGFPIQFNGHVLGVLMFFKQAYQSISIDMLTLAEGLGEQLGQYLERRRAEEALLLEQQRSERLLLNILPETIARCLKQNSKTIAEQFSAVTVLFADIVGFTELATRLSPIELVELLNDIFSAFDRLTEIHGLEKIKTIGDSYMVVSGLPQPRADHAQAIANMALDMQLAIQAFNRQKQRDFQIRIGIHSGSVVAGVIGLKKFIYDLWGDTVNTASRMESHGIPGKIQVTSTTYELLKESYLLERRGEIHIKGKGNMETYFLIAHQLTSLSVNAES